MTYPAKSLRPKNIWITLIPLLLLTGLVIQHLFEPELVQHERFMVFDRYQQSQPGQNENSPLIIVDIDDKSLEKFGRWLWSRRLLAILLTKIAISKPTVIGFDVLFSELDNTSIHNTLELWKGILSLAA